jgi:hypothetical protein
MGIIGRHWTLPWGTRNIKQVAQRALREIAGGESLFLDEGQSCREVGHLLGMSEGTVLDVVKRDRATQFKPSPYSLTCFRFRRRSSSIARNRQYYGESCCASRPCSSLPY